MRSESRPGAMPGLVLGDGLVFAVGAVTNTHLAFELESADEPD